MRNLAMLAALASLVALPAILAAQSTDPDEPPAQAKAEAKPGAKAKEAKKAPSKAKPPPTPAKVLFGAAKTPASLAARSIGFYAKGCLAGAARCRWTGRPGRPCVSPAIATGATRS